MVRRPLAQKDGSGGVRRLSWLGAGLGISLFLITGCRNGPPTDRHAEMPTEAAVALEQADELELLLEGRRVTVRDAADRSRLIQALKKGVQDSHGWSKGCFHPRLYMLNARRSGRTTSFRISFECWQVHMSEPDLDFSTSDSPQPVFDALLKGP